MPNVTTPPKAEYKDIPADIYEVVAFRSDTPSCPYEEIPNTFYDPEKDNPNKSTQLRWTFVIREEGELNGQRLTYYTGSYIGRHARNKMTNLTRILDPEFNIDKAYKSEDDYMEHVNMRPLRVTTEVNTKKQDDGSEKSYAKVTGILPSKLGDLTETEKLFLTSSEVKPF